LHGNLITMQPSRGWPDHELLARVEAELRRR
jgi:hypothetical protein